MHALTNKMALYSTSGSMISRTTFDEILIGWVLVVYPDSVNRASTDMQKEIEFLRFQLKEQDRVSEAKFRLKYKACMDALSVVDEIYLIKAKDKLKAFCDKHGITWPDPKETAKLFSRIRRCHNNLILTCDGQDVIEIFKKITGLIPTQYTADIVIDLRAAIRRELGFSGEIVETNREFAWFLVISPDPFKFD